MAKKKRRLTEDEVKEVRAWFEQSPIGHKPTIRQIARRYGVNQPSVVKSLGGWEGIKRGRPIPPPSFNPKHIDMGPQSPVKIGLYTEKVDIPDILR